MSLSPELSQKITSRLVNQLNPAAIILFGSHAWGNPDEESDIDLCVIVPDDTPNFDRIEWAAQGLEALMDMPISLSFDILVQRRSLIEQGRQIPGSLEQVILDKGLVLYDAAAQRAYQTLVNKS